MLGFKRVCRVCVDRVCRVCRVARKLLMQIPCDSEFLVMGEEMHYILSICVNRFSLDLRQSLFPGFPVSRFPLSRFPSFPGSRAFPFIRFNRWPYGREPARWPAYRKARFYSVKLRKHFFCFICLTLFACVVYRVMHVRNYADIKRKKIL